MFRQRGRPHRSNSVSAFLKLPGYTGCPSLTTLMSRLNSFSPIDPVLVGSNVSKATESREWTQFRELPSVLRAQTPGRSIVQPRTLQNLVSRVHAVEHHGVHELLIVDLKSRQATCTRESTAAAPDVLFAK